MIKGKQAYKKVVDSKQFTGQRLAIMEVYCEMHDKVMGACNGITHYELIDYMKRSRPDLAEKFKNMEHINKYQSRLRRAGVIKEGHSRICNVKGGTQLMKTHKITGIKPIPVPQPKTAAAKLKEVKDHVEYMMAMYQFEDNDVRADMIILKDMLEDE